MANNLALKPLPPGVLPGAIAGSLVGVILKGGLDNLLFGALVGGFAGLVIHQIQTGKQ